MANRPLTLAIGALLMALLFQSAEAEARPLKTTNSSKKAKSKTKFDLERIPVHPEALDKTSKIDLKEAIELVESSTFGKPEQKRIISVLKDADAGGIVELNSRYSKHEYRSRFGMHMHRDTFKNLTTPTLLRDEQNKIYIKGTRSYREGPSSNDLKTQETAVNP